MAAPLDPNSLANLREVRCKHLHMDLRVDFEAAKLVGSATLTLEVQASGAQEIHLDSAELRVTGATVDGAPAAWSLDAPEAPFGRRLRVPLPPTKRTPGTRVDVCVEYSTGAGASAVQWLPKEQTADKTHPYVFTQCQAIHARSMVPCQDAPMAKCPYTASITAPAWATVLASATAEDGSGAELPDGQRRFTFRQELPVPSYLIALAVGRLESREISHRCRVWSEPSVVDAAAYEFAQAETFVSYAEDLLTPYEWGRYDVLLMPPSFPYGGMENPQITFVTNSLLAGDRSLADVICHEVAHSWSGNLVSCQNWASFFLNEGVTMWIQRKCTARVAAELHGDGTPDYQRRYFENDALLGLKALQDDVDRYGAEHPYTKLVPDLTGVDPDDCFSRVPYEGGFSLLVYLESLVGTPEFEAFMKGYFRRFRMGCVSADDFKQHFLSHFADKGKDAALAQIEWDRWFYEPGMPVVVPQYDSSLLDDARRVADAWLAAGAEGRAAADVDGFGTKQLVALLDRLLVATAERGQPMPVADLHAMGALYGFAASKNAELRFRYLSLCLRAGDQTVFDDVVAMLKFTGRMKFVRPLFRDLAAIEPAGRELALHFFTEWRANYHPICAKMVAQDLGVGNSAAVVPSSVPAAPAGAGAGAGAGSGSAADGESGVSASAVRLIGGVVLAAAAVGAAMWLRRRQRSGR